MMNIFWISFFPLMSKSIRCQLDLVCIYEQSILVIIRFLSLDTYISTNTQTKEADFYCYSFCQHQCGQMTTTFQFLLTLLTLRLKIPKRINLSATGYSVCQCLHRTEPSFLADSRKHNKKKEN